MKKFSFFSKYIFLVSAAAFLGAVISVTGTKMGYEIEKNKKKLAKLQTENRYIMKSISADSSNKSIEIKAERLGLKYPEPYSIVMMDEEKSKNSEESGWLAGIFKSSKSKT